MAKKLTLVLALVLVLACAGWLDTEGRRRLAEGRHRMEEGRLSERLKIDKANAELRDKAFQMGNLVGVGCAAAITRLGKPAYTTDPFCRLLESDRRYDEIQDELIALMKGREGIR